MTLASLLGALLTTLSLPPSQASELWRQYVELPYMSGIDDVVVDEARDRLYVLGSPGGLRKEVFSVDTEGTVLGRVAVPRSYDLALSPDGARLYIGTMDQPSITVIDTNSFAMSTLPAELNIGRIDVIGHKLWYLVPEPSGFGQVLRTLDLSTGEMSDGPDVRSGPERVSSYAELFAVPDKHQLLVVEHPSSGPDQLAVVDTDSATVLSRATNPTSYGTVVSPDGDRVVLGRDWTTLSLPDLQPLDAGPPPWPGAPMTAEENLIVAVGENSWPIAVLDRASRQVLKSFEFDNDAGPMFEPRLVNGTLVSFGDSRGDLHLRMYVETAPTAPGPTLTLEATDAVARRPVTLSGVVKDETGAGVADVPVTVAQSSNASGFMGTATTDATGTWYLPYTWTSRGAHDLTATVDSAAVSKPLRSRLYLRVAPLPTSLEISAPETVAPGENITVTGRLTSADDGTPVAGVALGYWTLCSGAYHDTPTPRSSHVTTDAEGRFSATYDPGYCLVPALSLDWSAPGDTHERAVVTTTVPWHVAWVDIDAPRLVLVGDSTDGTIAVTIDGQPAADQAVELTIDGDNDVLQSEVLTTDDEGLARFSLPLELGNYQLSARVAGTSDTTPGLASAPVPVERVWTSLENVAWPQPISLGEVNTMSGWLERSNGVLAGVPVQLTAQDYTPYLGPKTPSAPAGPLRTKVVLTDALGHYQVRDRPRVAGWTEYQLVVLEDGPRFSRSNTVTVFAGVRATPTITTTISRSHFTAGQRATIRVKLRGALSDQVRVRATRPDGVARLLYQGPEPAGGLTLHQVMRHNETVTAVAPATDLQVGATTSRRVTVDARVTARALSRSLVANRVPAYSRSSSPRFEAEMSPDRAACVRFHVQQRSAGEWHSTGTSRCLHRKGQGGFRWAYRGEHERATYRIRAQFAGDLLNTGDASSWMRFRLL